MHDSYVSNINASSNDIHKDRLVERETKYYLKERKRSLEQMKATISQGKLAGRLHTQKFNADSSKQVPRY